MQSDTTQFQWALDIGNTSAKLAIFKGKQRVFFKQVFHAELEHLLSDLEQEFTFNQRVFCNVSNPHYGPKAKDWIVFTGQVEPHWQVDYQNPRSMGVDRVAAALGAHACSQSKSVMVVDCGSCVTYTWLNNTAITGLAIAPGRQMRWRAMSTFTAHLPLIDDKLEFLDGPSTEQNLWVGGHIGWLQEVLAMCNLFLSDYPIKEIIFTGTDAVYLKDFLPQNAQIVEGLNLIGLKVWLDEK
jgi:type III pantothenate kinase